MSTQTESVEKLTIKVIGRRKIKRKIPYMKPEEKYMKSLTDKEKHTLKIAREHLGSSFSLERSIGYVDYFCNRNV